MQEMWAKAQRGGIAAHMVKNAVFWRQWWCMQLKCGQETDVGATLWNAWNFLGKDVRFTNIFNRLPDHSFLLILPPQFTEADINSFVQDILSHSKLNAQRAQFALASMPDSPCNTSHENSRSSVTGPASIAAVNQVEQQATVAVTAPLVETDTPVNSNNENADERPVDENLNDSIDDAGQGENEAEGDQPNDENTGEVNKQLAEDEIEGQHDLPAVAAKPVGVPEAEKKDSVVFSTPALPTFTPINSIDANNTNMSSAWPTVNVSATGGISFLKSPSAWTPGPRHSLDHVTVTKPTFETPLSLAKANNNNTSLLTTAYSTPVLSSLTIPPSMTPNSVSAAAHHVTPMRVQTSVTKPPTHHSLPLRVSSVSLPPNQTAPIPVVPTPKPKPTPSSNTLQVDEQMKGASQIVLSPIKIRGAHALELGTDTVLSPIRQSIRLNSARKSQVPTPSSSMSMAELLASTNYAYSPNPAIKNPIVQNVHGMGTGGLKLAPSKLGKEIKVVEKLLVEKVKEVDAENVRNGVEEGDRKPEKKRRKSEIEFLVEESMRVLKKQHALLEQDISEIEDRPSSPSTPRRSQRISQKLTPCLSTSKPKTPRASPRHIRFASPS
eukprot:c18556_g1_i2.p1 GENE.c18556_g1_i2~~c18556_g1_i2.p1  ORF type:complete len:608 (-),score=153.94 c18556_g1_i2:120-1943(-)